MMTGPLTGHYEGRPRDTPAVEVRSSSRSRLRVAGVVMLVAVALTLLLVPRQLMGMLAFAVAVIALAGSMLMTFRSITADEQGLLVRRRLTHDLVPWSQVHAIWLTPRPSGVRQVLGFGQLHALIGRTAQTAKQTLLAASTDDQHEDLVRVRSVVPDADRRRIRWTAPGG